MTQKKKGETLPQRIRAGCDIASSPLTSRDAVFATAHSRGLRPVQTEFGLNYVNFATAHSRGLRPAVLARCRCCRSLPQRIRAGCDLTTSGQYSKRLRFATAHSRGLRLCRCKTLALSCFFATAHSRGLRLRKSNAAHCEFAARR